MDAFFTSSTIFVRPSIKQVAQLAGVSISTVSRLLNTPGAVSAQTAEKIHRSIAQLGFRPNFTGRNLRSGHSRTVGVVLPALTDAVFAHCLQGIELAARELGYAVLFATTGCQPDAESAVVEMLIGHRVDGMILTVADAAANACLDVLEREGIPFVLAGSSPAAPQAGVPSCTRTSVSIDNRAAARDAVRHLLQLGHRRIRMLSGRFEAADHHIRRHEGYLDAMREAGLDPLPVIQVASHTPTLVACRQMMAAVDGGEPHPTALFCASDWLAMCVMRDLNTLGLRVPEDMSVMGIDGLPVGELMQPALSSVAQPFGRIGDVALRALVEALECGATAPTGMHRVLPHVVRAGGTTAAPGSPERPASDPGQAQTSSSIGASS